MADSGGLILISPLIQEALSKATSFAAGKASLPLPQVCFRPGSTLKERFEELVELLTSIQAVVERAEDAQESDPAIRLWLQRLSDAIYDAVDLLDEVDYNVIEKVAEMPSKNRQEQVHTSFSPSIINVTVDFDENMISRFATINVSLSETIEKVDFIELMIQLRKEDLATTKPDNDIFRLFGNLKNVVGRENEVSEILDLLETMRYQNRISGISIVGMAGIGKTTVASLIYREAKEKEFYDVVAWVRASGDFNDERILKEMLEFFDVGAVHAKGKGQMDDMLQYLSKKLEKKTFLLFLDDLWERDADKWNVFAGRLSKVVDLTDGRCSIVLTTQSKRVASVTLEEKLLSLHRHEMGLLSGAECWSIMKETVLRSSSETSIQPDLEYIGQRISRHCWGLPLAAVVIGETLSRQLEINEWMAINDNEDWLCKSEDGSKILSVLKTSFDRLSSPLKKCFSYCSVFTKGPTIKRDELVLHWMAQGYLHRPNGSSMTLEDVGNQYLSDLLSNSFFQNEVRDSCGNVISCKLHDIMHDLALFVSKGESLIWDVTCDFNSNANIRHLRVEKFHYKYHAASIPEEVVQRVRSLFGENSYIPYPVESELRSLRCLELKDYDNTIWPLDLGKSKYLKYLSISNGSFEMSESFFKLCYLETLKLIQCPKLMTLRIGMGLKNLSISDCSGLTSIQSICKLASLQSFKLSNCKQLQSLPIELDSCFSLKQLRIDYCPELTSTPSMHGLSSLQSLEISGCTRLTSLAAGLGSLNSLKNLRIGQCRALDLITSIQWLPSLESLEIIDCTYLSTLPVGPGFISLKNLKISDCSSLALICFNGVLLSLKSLKLEKCERLTSLEVGPASLVSIENLTIIDCLLLVSIPCKHGLSSLESLEIRNHNGLRSLPTGLGTCVSLKSLELEECAKLESLSAELGSCISLQKLSIRNCSGIKYIPEDMKKLPSLVCLEIYECRKLSSIPEEWLGSLTSLTELTMGPFLEALEEFPGLTSLQNTLKILKIVGWSKLKSLPPQLEQLTALQELEMTSFDQVEVLPEWFGNLSSLRRLKIASFNKLRQFPSQEAMLRLSNLQSLVVRGCQQYMRTYYRGGPEFFKVSHISWKLVC